MIVQTRLGEAYTAVLYATKDGDWMVKDCEHEGVEVGKFACFRGRDVETIRMVTATWGELEESPETSRFQSKESSLDPLPAIDDLAIVQEELFPKRTASPQVWRDLSTPIQSLSEQSLTAIQRINPGFLHWTPPAKQPDPPDSLLDLFFFSVPQKFPLVPCHWPVPSAKSQY